MSNGIKISQLENGGSIAQEDYLPVARGSDETYRIAAKQFVVNASTQGSGSSIVIGKEDGAGQTLLFRSLSGVDGISIVNVGNTTVVSGSGQNPIKTVFTGTGSQVDFPFPLINTSSRNVNNYRVDIDGVLQEPGQTADYFLNGSNLTFTSAPPLSSKIVVVSNNLLPLVEPGNITATGTSFPRSLEDRFSDNINVKDFGVVGDGVTDDTAAFTAALKAFFNNDNKLHLDLNGFNIAIASNIVIRFGTGGFNADAGIRSTRLGRRIHNGRLRWTGDALALSGTMLDIGTNVSVVADAALKSFTFENVQFDAEVNSKSLVSVFNFYKLTFASCQFLNFSNATAVFLPSNDDSNNYTDDNGACFYDCRWACLPSSANHTGTPILAYCGDLVVSRGFAEWCGPFDFHIGHILIEGLHWSFGNVSAEMRLAAIFRDPRQIQVLNCDNDNCGLLFTTAGYAANTTHATATNIRNIIVSGNKYGVKDVPAGNGVITFEFTNAGTSFRNTYIGGNSCTAVGVASPVSFLRVKTSGSGTLAVATNFYQFTEALDVVAGDKDFGTAALGASNFSTYVGTDNLISRGFFVNSQAGIRNDAANGIRFDAGNSEKWTLLSDGTFSPKITNTYSIGSAGLRCADVHSNSFNLGPDAITISFRNSGSPEGQNSAPVGSIIVRADGTPGATLYIKESGGTGNTGWVAK
jgi:ribosomal protein L27